MAQNKKSFVIHIDSLDVIDSMSGDQTKELLLAFRDYHLGAEPKLEGLMNSVFTIFKNQFDRDLVKYNKIVERNKENGNKGGRPKKIVIPKKPTGLLINQDKPKKPDSDSDNVIINNKDNIDNKFPFSKITDFQVYLSSFSLNKSYLFVAYKFWKLWQVENPNNNTVKEAKVSKWYDAIRLIIEVDEQPIDRLLVIYFYFEKCQQEESGFDRFWFDTIKSVGALRTKDSHDVYRIDKIIDIVNRKVNQDPSFRNLVGKKIEEFKKYESVKLH